ncbi:hypothetical protein AB0230_01700 [Microbacterium sp. NPDC089190]|uniref:hypothetical protein n=1 Tax=Microbacterium sp. NPDC089190 TaxID=3155063 RepID=UPI00344CF106
MNGWRWPQNEDVIVSRLENGNYRVFRESTGEERFCDGKHSHNAWETAASDFADELVSTDEQVTRLSYYDPARQERTSEHRFCVLEDGEWWFGHGMSCRYADIHGIPEVAS